MKTKDVAKILGVSKMTVRNLADQGKLKCSQINSHREYDLKDVREYYLSKLMVNLLTVISNYQQIKEIRLHKEHDALINNYYRLMYHEMVNKTITIAGTRNGYLKKLVYLFQDSISEQEKYQIEIVISELEKLLQEIRNFRNSKEHSIFEECEIKKNTVEDAVKKLIQLFEIINPHHAYEVFGSEDWIYSYFANKTQAKQHDELKFKLLSQVGNTLKINLEREALFLKNDKCKIEILLSEAK